MVFLCGWENEIFLLQHEVCIVSAKNSLPFLLSRNLGSDQITLQVLLNSILWETHKKKEFLELLGMQSRGKKERREKNSSGDMISVIRNRAKLGL